MLKNKNANTALPPPNKIDTDTPRGNISSDYLLLFAAFGLGLIGLYIGNLWFAPKVPDSQPPVIDSEMQSTLKAIKDDTDLNKAEVASLKTKVTELTSSVSQAKADLQNKLEAIEKLSQTKPVETAPVTTPEINQAQIMDNLNQAETFLANPQPWTNNNEELLKNLEKNFAIKNLPSELNTRLRSSLKGLYDLYIENLIALMSTDKDIAATKIKQLQGQNETLPYSKRYTLTTAQRNKIDHMMIILATEQ